MCNCLNEVEDDVICGEGCGISWSLERDDSLETLLSEIRAS